MTEELLAVNELDKGCATTYYCKYNDVRSVRGSNRSESRLRHKVGRGTVGVTKDSRWSACQTLSLVMAPGKSFSVAEQRAPGQRMTKVFSSRRNWSLVDGLHSVWDKIQEQSHLRPTMYPKMIPAFPGDERHRKISLAVPWEAFECTSKACEVGGLDKLNLHVDYQS